MVNVTWLSGVVKVWFYIGGDECLWWWMSEVVNVWGGERLILDWGWWTSDFTLGVVNVLQSRGYVHLIFVSAQIWDIHFVHYDEAALNIKWQISRHGNSITLLQCFRPLLSINVHSFSDLGFVKNLPVGPPLWILLYHPISFQGKHIARAYDILAIVRSWQITESAQIVKIEIGLRVQRPTFVSKVNLLLMIMMTLTMPINEMLVNNNTQVTASSLLVFSVN